MKQFILLLFISILFSFSPNSKDNVDKGYIYKVAVNVDEQIMERSPSDNNSDPDAIELEMLDKKETIKMLDVLSKELVVGKVAETVDYLKQSSTGSNMLGNMGSNAVGANKLSIKHQAF